ncbi:MAG: hypothetical protein EBT77_02905 [Verrucomicrobia bacterium]|nr:hypothetical protein [Verrucomicrobiota bacterium]
MREAVEEARRIGHEVDHALEKRAAREGKHGIQQGQRVLPRLPLGEVLSAVSWMAKELVQAVGHVARKLTPRRKSVHTRHRRHRRRRGRGYRPGGRHGNAPPA